MHLTVSALSHQIRGLEDRLGQQLFVRKPRGVTLTDDGQRLFERIAAAPGRDRTRAASLRHAPRRRADADPDAVVRDRAGWCRACRASSPRIRSWRSACSRRSASVDFERDTELDAGLRYGPGKWPGLEAVHLFDDWVTPIASPALIERLGRPTLADARRLSAAGRARRTLERVVRALRRQPPKRYVANFDDSETLHRAAVEGMGIVLGRLTLARPLIDAGRLVPSVRRAAQGRLQPLPGVPAALALARRAGAVPRLAAGRRGRRSTSPSKSAPHAGTPPRNVRPAALP